MWVISLTTLKQNAFQGYWQLDSFSVVNILMSKNKKYRRITLREIFLKQWEVVQCVMYFN